MLQVAKKIVREYCPKKWDLPRTFLGQEKVRLIKKGREEMRMQGITRSLKKLDLHSLEKFIPLYLSFIKKKHNSNPHNLKEHYLERIQKDSFDDQLFFANFEQSWTIIAGWIFIFKKNNCDEWITSLWFRAYDENFIIKKQKLGTYLEYLFYERALQKNPDIISRGQDRNWAWEIWSALGIVYHKLEAKFLPKLPKVVQYIKIEESTLKTPTLFFINPNEEGYFKEAILFKSEICNNIDEIKNIFQKRNLSLEFR